MKKFKQSQKNPKDIPSLAKPFYRKNSEEFPSLDSGTNISLSQPVINSTDLDIRNGKLNIFPSQKKDESKNDIEEESFAQETSRNNCNLFVKGFDPKENKESLTQLFLQYGEIESIRIFEATEGHSPYAYVCYKTPATAELVKNSENLTIGGKTLYVNNNYDIKQESDIKNEETKEQ